MQGCYEYKMNVCGFLNEIKLPRPEAGPQAQCSHFPISFKYYGTGQVLQIEKQKQKTLLHSSTLHL